MEHFERESVQKFSLGQEPAHRFESPASLRKQELGDVVKLGNFGVRKPFDILFHLYDGLVSFVARIFLEKGLQFVVAVLPNFFLCRGVFNVGNFGVTDPVVERELRNKISSFSINGVSKARMV